MNKFISDEQILKALLAYNSTKAAAESVGLSVRQFCSRKAAIPNAPKYNRETKSFIKREGLGRIETTMQDGKILVFSDAHFQPDQESTAYRALLLFIKQFRPEIIVCNGDAFDGNSVSRHPKVQWGKSPSVKEEIDAVKEALGQIEMLSKGKLVWCLGNHDARFEGHLIAHAGEQYEGIHGFALKDHFPRWMPCWSLWVNDIVIKHRYKNGIHATHNNLTSGKHMITGHLHSQKVTPFTDYNGTRYGVDSGCLAPCFAEQFLYAEDNPRNWRSGFALLTVKDGKLIMPELCMVVDEDEGLVEFRGDRIKV